jgi:aminoglycoside 3-N-acetyltransferase I
VSDIKYYRLASKNITELRALLELYIHVFGDQKMPEDTSYLSKRIASENTLFFVAEQDGVILAGATAYILPSIYGDYDELYIYDMAVHADRQRQGIGSALLGYIKEYAKAHGVRYIYVQADTEDIHARNFYKKNGGIEEDVRHYDFEV